LFKKKEYHEAVKQYEIGLSACNDINDEDKKFQKIFHNNIGICGIRLERYEESVE